ncbi:MAG: peptidylprolyl isomerase [Anaerolineae bacterium]
MGKRNRPTVPIVNQRTLSRRQKEERYRRWVYVGGGLVLALVLGVLAAALIRVQIIEPASPVALVNGVPIRTDTYQRTVRFLRYDLGQRAEQLAAQISRFDPNDESQASILAYLQQQQQTLNLQKRDVANNALEQLIEDELVRQEAERRGITVSPEEVQREIERSFGYHVETPTPAPNSEATATVPATGTLAPTATAMSEEQFRAEYREAVERIGKASGYTEADLRDTIRVDLLRERLQEAMAAEVPVAAEQVHARHILVATREEAEKALERLRYGEKSVDLAKELSTDTSNKDQGGDLGWFPRGQMVPEFEAVAFALQPGQIQGPVETQFGFHLIKVEGREENRPIEPALLQQMRSNALTKWLHEQRYSGAVQLMWDSTKAPRD